MISAGSATRIFLATGATDMRRGYDGLADLVRNRLQIPIRCAALIDAPVGSVRRALGRSEVWARTARAVGGRLEVAGDPVTMTAGGLVRFSSGRGPSVLLRIREEAGRPLLETVQEVLRPRQLLLVLDNCEHLIESAAQVAEALLHGCPRARLLQNQLHRTAN